MIACIDGGIFCIPLTIVCILFPAFGLWLGNKIRQFRKKTCKSPNHEVKE